MNLLTFLRGILSKRYQTPIKAFHKAFDSTFFHQLTSKEFEELSRQKRVVKPHLDSKGNVVDGIITCETCGGDCGQCGGQKDQYLSDWLREQRKGKY